jgi:hypothetical protein
MTVARMYEITLDICRLIDEKNVRLQDLSAINKFCLVSQEKLHR